jgi:hypothetical protein
MALLNGCILENMCIQTGRWIDLEDQESRSFIYIQAEVVCSEGCLVIEAVIVMSNIRYYTTPSYSYFRFCSVASKDKQGFFDACKVTFSPTTTAVADLDIGKDMDEAHNDFYGLPSPSSTRDPPGRCLPGPRPSASSRRLDPSATTQSHSCGTS